MRKPESAIGEPLRQCEPYIRPHEAQLMWDDYFQVSCFESLDGISEELQPVHSKGYGRRYAQAKRSH